MWGQHVSFEDDFESAMDEAKEIAQSGGIKMQSAQIFVSNPRSWKLRDERYIYKMSDYISNNNITIIAHGSYLDSLNRQFFIKKEVEYCQKAGISGLVIHLPKNLILEDIQKLCNFLIATPKKGFRVYLEIPHLLPKNSKYESPEKLADLFSNIKDIDADLDHFGLCIDTAHLWSSGVDISSFEDSLFWLERFESYNSIIPPDKVIFHLNDSYVVKGSGVDKHAPLTFGKIWKDIKLCDSGLAAFVDYIHRHNSIAILEYQPSKTDYAIIDKLSRNL